MRTLKIESLSALTVISMDIWQKNAERRRRNKKPEYVLNATRKDISPEIAKGSK